MTTDSEAPLRKHGPSTAAAKRGKRSRKEPSLDSDASTPVPAVAALSFAMAPSTGCSSSLAFMLNTSEQEKTVSAVKATIPWSAGRQELRKDPIYRVMHSLPRSDVLEVVRSRFAKPHCERAAAYFDLSYMANPLRRLRLQLGCDGPTGLHLFFARIVAHRHTLRVVDFSRNRLGTEDAILLCNVLGLGCPGNVSAANLDPTLTALENRAEDSSGAPAASARTSAAGSFSAVSSLELLDLSYNSKIGNDGAIHVLAALQRCRSIRAVVLKRIGVNDAGAEAMSSILRHWPAPAAPSSGQVQGSLVYAHAQTTTAMATKFYLSLSGNYIGPYGTQILGKCLPDYVSLALTKQMPSPGSTRKRARDCD